MVQLIVGGLCEKAREHRSLDLVASFCRVVILRCCCRNIVIRSLLSNDTLCLVSYFLILLLFCLLLCLILLIILIGTQIAKQSLNINEIISGHVVAKRSCNKKPLVKDECILHMHGNS